MDALSRALWEVQQQMTSTAGAFAEMTDAWNRAVHHFSHIQGHLQTDTTYIFIAPNGWACTGCGFIGCLNTPDNADRLESEDRRMRVLPTYRHDAVAS